MGWLRTYYEGEVGITNDDFCGLNIWILVFGCVGLLK